MKTNRPNLGQNKYVPKIIELADNEAINHQKKWFPHFSFPNLWFTWRRINHSVWWHNRPNRFFFSTFNFPRRKTETMALGQYEKSHKSNICFYFPRSIGPKIGIKVGLYAGDKTYILAVRLSIPLHAIVFRW